MSPNFSEYVVLSLYSPSAASSDILTVLLEICRENPVFLRENTGNLPTLFLLELQYLTHTHPHPTCDEPFISQDLFWSVISTADS